MRLKILQERNAGYWPYGPAITALLESFTSNVDQVLGGHYEAAAGVFLKTHQYCCLDEESYSALGKRTLSCIKEDPSLLDKAYRHFLAYLPQFQRFCKTLTHTDGLTPKQLWEKYNTFYILYKEIYPWAEPLPYAIRDSIIESLEHYLKEKVSDKKKFGEYFTLLTTPVQKSFASKEEESLLKIYLLMQRESMVLEAFSGSMLSVKKVLSKHPYIDARIQKHFQEYSWIPFDYGTTVWNKEHFIASLMNLAKNHVDAQKRLKEIKSFTHRINAEKQKLYASIPIEKEYQQLFEAAALSAYLIDFKKEIFTKAHIQIQELLDTIARTIGITRTAMLYTVPDDIYDALLHKKRLDSQRLEARKYNSVGIAQNGKLRILEGRECTVFLNAQGFFDTAKAGVIEVKGMCACPGTVIGTVRFIRDARDVATLQKGEILVTFQTTPDFVPAMKKAAAIVTNEGGITSHAAIVSRELGIPCVIGTKIATQVFKNGDRVQVKATHGIVRKLERKL